MLPPKLRDFIGKVLKKTIDGELKWSFDEFATTVSTWHPQFSMEVRYMFNENSEMGEYAVLYKETGNSTEFRFVTDQSYETDYDLLRNLFNAAQASEIQFPF